MSKFTDLCASPNKRRRFLLIFNGADSGGAVHTFCFSTHPFVSAPTDTPANTIFAACMKEPGGLEEAMYASPDNTGTGTTANGPSLGGITLPTYSEIKLLQSRQPGGSGSLDYLDSYAFSGQTATLLMGGDGFAYSDYGVVLSGYMDDVLVDWSAVTVRMQDISTLFDSPLQPNLYLGTGLDTLDCRFTMLSNANAFQYQALQSVGNYVIQSGDTLTYEMQWPSIHGPSSGAGDRKCGFDFSCTDSTTLRGSGATDQNGLSAAPGGVNLTSNCWRAWYKRVIPIPAGMVGKTISTYMVVCEYDGGGFIRAMFRNIQIMNSTLTTQRKAIWMSGNAMPTFTASLLSPATGQSFAAAAVWEGDSQLQGKPKRYCAGLCRNATVEWVNVGFQIGQFHDGLFSSVLNVFDDFVTLGGTQYTIDPYLGYVTMNVTPAGTVTVTLQGDADPTYVSSFADIAARVITMKGQVPLQGAGIDSTSQTALNAKNSAVLGCTITTDGQTTMQQFLDEIADSVGAWYGWDQNARNVTFGRLEPPTGTAVITYTSRHIKSLERLPFQRPTMRQTLQYNHNLSPMDAGSLPGSVQQDTALANFAVNEWRTYQTPISTAITQQWAYPLDPPAWISDIDAKAGIVTEGARRQALYGVRRKMWRVTFDSAPLDRKIGDEIGISLPGILNFTAIVTSRKIEWTTGAVVLEVFE